MKVCAIIPAGGSGKRMGGEVPKQLLHLCGISVIVHTLQKFQAARSIDCIILVLPEEGEISTAWEAIRPFGLTKVVRIVSGGKERQIRCAEV